MGLDPIENEIKELCLINESSKIRIKYWKGKLVIKAGRKKYEADKDGYKLKRCWIQPLSWGKQGDKRVIDDWIEKLKEIKIKDYRVGVVGTMEELMHNYELVKLDNVSNIKYYFAQEPIKFEDECKIGNVLVMIVFSEAQIHKLFERFKMVDTIIYLSKIEAIYYQRASETGKYWKDTVDKLIIEKIIEGITKGPLRHLYEALRSYQFIEHFQSIAKC